MKKIRIEPGEESEAQEDEKYYCEVCGKEISEEQYEAYEGKSRLLTNDSTISLEAEEGV